MSFPRSLFFLLGAALLFATVLTVDIDGEAAAHAGGIHALQCVNTTCNNVYCASCLGGQCISGLCRCNRPNCP